MDASRDQVYLASLEALGQWQTLQRSAERAKKRTVGNPFDLNTEQGPQVNQEQMDKILGMIQQGAKLVASGNRPKGLPGYSVQPTDVADVQDNMKIAREEIFGPVQQPDAAASRSWTRSSSVPTTQTTAWSPLFSPRIWTRPTTTLKTGSLRAGTVSVNTSKTLAALASFQRI
ncbi:GL21091 [Drosophila persimilis]|uniref:GL21091 n=1 Tax=Drosophila persimilis TaxID=7234 RepID=B4GWZ9_DROPE|nr:GL21091 [Drosophila persimilis]